MRYHCTEGPFLGDWGDFGLGNCGSFGDWSDLSTFLFVRRSGFSAKTTVVLAMALAATMF